MLESADVGILCIGKSSSRPAIQTTLVNRYEEGYRQDKNSFRPTLFHSETGNYHSVKEVILLERGNFWPNLFYSILR